MCFKVLKQFADKQTLTRDLLGSSLHPPGARPHYCYPRQSLEASTRFAWIHGGRSIFRPFVIDFRPFSFRICGEMYVLYANNRLLGLLILQKASRAPPVCGLHGKSHTHPPRVPPPRSLVRSFPKFFFIFFHQEC